MVSDVAGFRAAVIGGGIAGLVAAWELARNGVEVELFEREARLGGRVCGGELGGVCFDLGPESYATRGGEVERLLTDLGLASRITSTSGGRSWVVADGRAAPLPSAGAIGIPARPWSAETRRVIGLQGALRCAIEPRLPRRVGRHESSLGGLVRARLGRRTLDRLVAPVVRGIYSANPYALPLDAVPGLAATYAERGSLRVAARRQRGSARASGAAVAGVYGGVHTLVTHLEQELERLGVRVHRETGIASLRRSRRCVNGYEVLSDGQTHTVDAVLLTVPGIPTETEADGRLGASASSDDRRSSDECAMSDVGRGASEAAEVPTRVEVIAILVEDARLNSAPRGTGALIAENARRAPVPITAKALTHANIKWRWLTEQLPANHHLLRLSYGEHGADGVTLQMPDPAVERLALADASAILGVELPELALRGMARQTHEIPRPGAGAQPSESASKTGSPQPEGIFTAGEWVAGTGFAAVIPSARAAATALIAATSAATDMPATPTLP